MVKNSGKVSGLSLTEIGKNSDKGKWLSPHRDAHSDKGKGGGTTTVVKVSGLSLTDIWTTTVIKVSGLSSKRWITVITSGLSLTETDNNSYKGK